MDEKFGKDIREDYQQEICRRKFIRPNYSDLNIFLKN